MSQDWRRGVGKLEGVKMEQEGWYEQEVWKLSDDLAYRVYQVTENFPKAEVYGLTTQVRRAAQ